MLLGYSRCSSAGQQHDLQIDALQNAGCERIWIETASGTRSDREELRKVLDFARSGEDVLCVFRLDRLARNVRHLIEITDELARRNIGLKSLTEAIDTTTPSGRLTLHIFAALGQFEAEQTRMRCALGRAAARARGRVGGRPRSLDETKVKVARALIANGQMTMAEVARHVGCAPSTLYRTLPGGRGVRPYVSF